MDVKNLNLRDEPSELQKQLITNVCKEVINFDSRKVILNWGQSGSGKTRIAYYFENNLSTILDISDDNFFHAYVNIPIDGQDANKEIIKNIFDNLSIRKIKREISATIKEIGKEELLERVNNKIRSKNFNDTIIHLSKDIFPIIAFQQYVFDGFSSKELKKIGLSKSLKTNEDYKIFLAAIIVAIVSGKSDKKFILWLDRVENMVHYYNSQQFKVMAQLFGYLVDRIDENFLVFLNFTCTGDLDSVRLSLGDELWSRIDKKIRFQISSVDTKEIPHV